VHLDLQQHEARKCGWLIIYSRIGTICFRVTADEDKQQIAKLEKKLAKLRKQLKSQQPSATADTGASTESEDSAVAVPAETSQGIKGKKDKKRSREAAGGWPERVLG
jgi:hypothetical protein